MSHDFAAADDAVSAGKVRSKDGIITIGQRNDYRRTGCSSLKFQAACKNTKKTRCDKRMSNSSSEHYDLLKGTDLFAGLGKESLDALCKNGRLLTFRRNTILMTEGEVGESLCILKRGSVKIFASDEQGNEIVLDDLRPGSYFGEVSLLDDEPRTASAITLEPSEILSISKSDFVLCVEKNPEIAFAIIRVTTRRLRRAIDTVRSLALQNVYQRLTSKLRELSENSENTVSLPRRYSNQELGAMIGASREMVGRILNDLALGGYIEKRLNRWFLLKELPDNW